MKREQLEENVIAFWLKHLNEMDSYLDRMEATQEEREDVYGWVEEGNNYMTNGDYLYGDDGELLDFVEAQRTFEEIRKKPINANSLCNEKEKRRWK